MAWHEIKDSDGHKKYLSEQEYSDYKQKEIAINIISGVIAVVITAIWSSIYFIFTLLRKLFIWGKDKIKTMHKNNIS